MYCKLFVIFDLTGALLYSNVGYFRSECRIKSALSACQLVKSPCRHKRCLQRRLNTSSSKKYKKSGRPESAPRLRLTRIAFSILNPSFGSSPICIKNKKKVHNEIGYATLGLHYTTLLTSKEQSTGTKLQSKESPIESYLTEVSS